MIVVETFKIKADVTMTTLVQIHMSFYRLCMYLSNWPDEIYSLTHIHTYYGGWRLDTGFSLHVLFVKFEGCYMNSPKPHLVIMYVYVCTYVFVEEYPFVIIVLPITGIL